MLKSLTRVAVAAALAAGPALASDQAVKVGMITTLSGGGSGLGIDVRDGFLLAIKGNDKIEMVIEDDQRKPDVAVQIADKMIQSEKVDVLIGIIWSNLAMAVVPAATAQGKFYLSPNAGPSALAGKGCSPLYFNVAWQNDAFYEAGGLWASENGIEKVFLMAPNYPAGTDGMTGFKRTFNGEVVGEVYTKLGQTDYAAEIAQIRASDADTVYFFLPGGMGISFMKQFSGSGVDKNVMGPAFSFDQGILGAKFWVGMQVVPDAEHFCFRRGEVFNFCKFFHVFPNGEMPSAFRGVNGRGAEILLCALLWDLPKHLRACLAQRYVRHP